MKDDKGIVLIVAISMLSLVFSLVLISNYVMKREADNEARYHLTLQRLQEVKRALFGKLADIYIGDEITSCGGFFSDFGTPYRIGEGTVDNDPLKTGNFLDVLVRGKDVTDPEGPNWQRWHFDEDKGFSAGYRGEGYLVPPPGYDTFVDAWGSPIKVTVLGCGAQITIESLGSDGKPGGEGYEKDISLRIYPWLTTRFYVTVTNKTDEDVNLDVELIYPRYGEVQIRNSESGAQLINRDGGEATFEFLFECKMEAVAPGLRKIVVRDADTNEVKLIKNICVPFPSGDCESTSYAVSIDYEG